MEKEISCDSNEIVKNQNRIDLLISLQPDPYQDYKDLIEEAKDSSCNCDEGSLYNMEQITSPKENGDTANNNEDPSSSKIQENYKTPHSNKRNATNGGKQSEAEALEASQAVVRHTPLPLMSWADSSEVWQNMIYKEEATLNMRNSKLFHDKNAYLPRMRAILLDWIMEVCEVYHLGRATYYLAVDYIDRFLTIMPTIPKTQLQLLGITCLFVAAKLEEIYPPKLAEFSYVCDGACTEQEILACEVLVLNTLDWNVNPMTPTGWLNLYLQIHYNVNNLKKQKLHEGVTSNFQFPQYSGYEFTRASHVMDLFSMDPGYLDFSYSIVAAGAVHYIFGKDIALNVSGLTWSQLAPCVNYMYVFNKVLTEAKDPRLFIVPSQTYDERLNSSFRALKKRNPFIVPDENHRLQTHIIDLQYFEKTAALRSQICENKDKILEESDIKDCDNENCQSPVSIANDCTTTDVITEIEKILEEHYLNNEKDLICNEKTTE